MFPKKKPCAFVQNFWRPLSVSREYRCVGAVFFIWRLLLLLVRLRRNARNAMLPASRLAMGWFRYSGPSADGAAAPIDRYRTVELEHRKQPALECLCCGDSSERYYCKAI